MQTKDESSRIPAAKAQLLHKAVLEACDGTDGIKDGVIDDPTKCKFDPGVLECKGDDAATCLTKGQAQTARLIYMSPVNPKSPHGAWEYHENLIPKSDPKPLRVWLEVSENDNGSKRDEASLHNWVMANQRMAAALKAKGYHYRYVFAKGAGHTDGKVTRQTLPEALEWLWQGYPKR